MQLLSFKMSLCDGESLQRPVCPQSNIRGWRSSAAQRQFCIANKPGLLTLFGQLKTDTLQQTEKQSKKSWYGFTVFLLWSMILLKLSKASRNVNYRLMPHEEFQIAGLFLTGCPSFLYLMRVKNWCHAPSSGLTQMQLLPYAICLEYACVW